MRTFIKINKRRMCLVFMVIYAERRKIENRF